MKKILSTTFCLFFTLALQAQTEKTVITLTDGSTVTYTSDQYDKIVIINELETGVKVYLKNRKSKDYLATKIETTTEGGGDSDDSNNKNRNLMTAADAAQYPYAWRLEYPHLKRGNSIVSVHSTVDYGITYSVEWDCDKKSQRWSVYQFHNGIPDNNVGRTGSWKDDPNIPSAYQTHSSQYTGSGYSRGHMCMSNDRQSSDEQNGQTFYMSNAHPQNQNHNEGLWLTLETKVNNWGNSSSFRDTLYVVKAGTIDSSDKIKGYTSSGLLIPQYFYMAILCLKNNKYKAIGFWTEHTTTKISNAKPADYAISIKELEERTGIDFFCNLPDDIEEEVEASYTLSDWGL